MEITGLKPSYVAGERIIVNFNGQVSGKPIMLITHSYGSETVIRFGKVKRSLQQISLPPVPLKPIVALNIYSQTGMILPWQWLQSWISTTILIQMVPK